jgi:hypothetical protein
MRDASMSEPDELRDSKVAEAQFNALTFRAKDAVEDAVERFFKETAETLGQVQLDLVTWCSAYPKSAGGIHASTHSLAVAKDLLGFPIYHDLAGGIAALEIGVKHLPGTLRKELMRILLEMETDGIAEASEGPQDAPEAEE